MLTNKTPNAVQQEKKGYKNYKPFFKLKKKEGFHLKLAKYGAHRIHGKLLIVNKHSRTPVNSTINV